MSADYNAKSDAIAAIYELALSGLCSPNNERRYLLDILRQTFPPGPKGDVGYNAMLKAIGAELQEDVP